ncbi:ferredoxin [Pelagovum pacificum]|nr:ferredoxin [Pelagovum pacificum]
MFVSGHLSIRPEDGLPPTVKSLALLSPDEPRFWTLFRQSAEYLDGEADPLDRWSARVIGQLSEAVGGTPVFPFGGPPWHPFIAWALRSGRAWSSPVGLLVHDSAGLFISYRGAIGLAETFDDTPPAAPPCEECSRPCATACPVGAFAGGSYDVPLCKSWLDRPEGRDCRDNGCLVRRACPVGADLRDPQQSAFHMSAFHRPVRKA